MQDPRTIERRLQLDSPVLERLVLPAVPVLGQGPGVDLRGQLRQASQVHPRQGCGDEDRVGGRAAVRRQLIGPGTDRPGERLGNAAFGQRRRDLGVGGGPPDPRSVRDGGAFGDSGLVTSQARGL